jgi:two-component system, chemotaxis family, chemotaxis protein CheY
MPCPSDLKVLVVDDQQSMRGLARQCLTRIGIRTITAVHSAEAALEELQNAKYDVIISDLNMEGMSGIDLMNNIRSNPILKNTPFILATSECYKPAEGMDPAAGSQFVAKPFSVADLKNGIQKVVGDLDED